MNDATPIKKGRKFDQVLDGARCVFLADGYEGASVDAIARAAGVSKATLYSYFADKRLLFMEVARTECQGQLDDAKSILDGGKAPQEVLAQAGRRMMGLILSPFGQAIFRMCVAEGDRFPELGREFYRTGPKVFHDTLVVYFRQAIARGELEIDDMPLASDQFIKLCHATLFTEMMFGMRKTASEAEIGRVVDGAVETFLARYAA